MIKLFLFLSTVVLFGDSLSLDIFNGYFDYTDHTITLVIFIIGLLISFKLILSRNHRLNEVKKAIFIIYMVSLFSIITSLFNEKISFFGLAVGYIYFFKFFFFFIAGIGVTYCFKNINLSNKMFLSFYKIVFLFTIIMSLLNLSLPELWATIYPVQHIFEGQRLVGPFTNAGRTSWLLVCFLIFAMVFYRGKKRIILTLPLLYLQMLTYVKKSLFGYLITIVVFSKDKLKSYSVKNRIFLTFIVFFSLLLISAVFSDYFLRTVSEYSGDALNDRNARYMLLLGGLKVLNIEVMSFSYFIGVGLSSWGGYASSIVYSDYYYMLGFDSMWGFIPGASSYTGDLYISHVLVEVGVLGLIGMIYAIYYIYKFILKLELLATEIQSNNIVKFIKLLFILILVESLAISSLEISQMIIITFFVPGLYFGTLLKKSV